MHLWPKKKFQPTVWDWRVRYLKQKIKISEYLRLHSFNVEVGESDFDALAHLETVEQAIQGSFQWYSLRNSLKIQQVFF